MTCNCTNNHYLETVTTSDTAVSLTVTDSTNISSLENFNLIVNKCIGDYVTGSPLPVQVEVNGTAVSLYNRYSLPVLSNRIPKRAKGAYVVPSSGTPYVILFTTPQCKCNA